MRKNLLNSPLVSSLRSPVSHRRIQWVLLAMALIVLPFGVGPYWTHVLGSVGLYIMLGLGLNIVVGFAGLLHLGYVAFYALGAYLYAFLASPQFSFHLSFWLLLPICFLATALAGALLGIPALRTRGDYLAIVTLGFGEIVRLLLNNLDPLTGGPKGILEIDPPVLFGLAFNRPETFYYLVLTFSFLSAFLTKCLNASRVGRAWVAIREDEDAAQAMGIDVVKYKLLALGVGCSFAGVGGALFASRQGSIFPGDFGLMISINVLCLVIIGGMGSVPGVVLGSAVLVGLPEVLRALREYRMLIFGALLVAMMIFRPGGFIPEARLRKLEIRD